MKNDRRSILLQAAYDMLKKQLESGYVISPFETTVLAEERARIVMFCKMSIEVLLANAEAEDFARGRIDAYKRVLQQLGESE